MVLLGFAVLAGADFGVRLLWLVPGVTLDVLLTVTMCLVLSVSHVYLRDTRYVVQALAVGWLWVTPVVYPLATLHGWVRALVEANPVTGVAQLFHAALVTDVGALWPAWVTVAWIAGLAAVGTVLNARYDRVVSDLL
jgi:ABC-type polysaccharide/polyol phosphate export permease